MDKSCVVYALGENLVLTNYRSSEGYYETTIDTLTGIDQDIYLYNAYTEVAGSRLILQSFLDRGFDLNRITVPILNGRLSLSDDGKEKLNFRQADVEVLFSNDGFEAVLANKEVLDILKYMAAGFCKVYGALPAEVHSTVRQNAVSDLRKVEDELVAHYSSLGGLEEIRSFLRQTGQNSTLQKLHIAEVASQGLVKLNYVGESGTIMHGHKTAEMDRAYNSILKATYRTIKLEGYGFPYTIQAGSELVFGNSHYNTFSKYNKFKQEMSTLVSEHGNEKYVKAMRVLVETLYYKDIFISECNPGFILLLVNKDSEDFDDIVAQVLEESGFRGILKEAKPR